MSKLKVKKYKSFIDLFNVVAAILMVWAASSLACNVPVEQYENDLYKRISSEKVLKSKGLSNELPYYIYPYPAAEELDAVGMLHRIRSKLAAKGIVSIELNIYEIIIECLKAQNILDAVLQAEETMTDDEFENAIKNAANV